MTTPNFTARAAQAHAAGELALAEALDSGHTIAARGMPDGPAWWLVKQLIGDMRSGGLGLCSHAARNPSQPLFWLPAVPRQVRCGMCTRAACLITEALARAAAVCDVCDRPPWPGEAPLRADVTLIPPSIDEGKGIVLGPIFVASSLCEWCS